MKLVTVILVSIALVVINAYDLVLVWETHEPKDGILKITFSDNGHLGVASGDKCAYVFDANGSLLGKKCGSKGMRDVDYSNGTFAFSNYDDYVYLLWENGTYWKEIYVGDERNVAVEMLGNGFVVCESHCTRYDLQGNVIWDRVVTDRYVIDLESSGNYLYLTNFKGTHSYLEVRNLSDGSLVTNIDHENNVIKNLALRGNFLIASSFGVSYVYDISDPQNVSILGALGPAEDFAISPDSSYAVMVNSSKVVIYNTQGEAIYEAPISNALRVDWWNNLIAIGFEDGTVKVYKFLIEDEEPQEEVATTVLHTETNTQSTESQSVSGIPFISIAVIPLTRLKRKLRK
ncbi:hypothetical protein EYM_02200 [Ignicoccus islandicus DSM 13165]|uniref:Anaphase-promoting complex subunit 4 WD40 domain-containing protein n=1 Tax=Ignicoccus islandicus DSM 13165 TaxID=940295 RepID=A0A0U3E309_9CREN|nr:hypothetical protein [Ignicoccus islandicus]ALU12299.1 hypothetical protein EYM_02200 [Ignicoccus islandicus DSM 13165]